MANLISQKCYYAIKALFDLARYESDSPIKIGQIAERQAIPIRFLEAILRQLRQAGFVESRRGSDGGYLLAMRPMNIRLLDIIAFFEGELAQFPADGATGKRLEADTVLSAVWRETQKSLEDVFGNWTIADLVEKAEANQEYVANFSI